MKSALFLIVDNFEIIGAAIFSYNKKFSNYHDVDELNLISGYFNKLNKHVCARWVTFFSRVNKKNI